MHIFLKLISLHFNCKSCLVLIFPACYRKYLEGTRITLVKTQSLHLGLQHSLFPVSFSYFILFSPSYLVLFIFLILDALNDFSRGENRYDFAIRTPCTPSRWDEFDAEMAKAWEVCYPTPIYASQQFFIVIYFHTLFCLIDAGNLTWVEPLSWILDISNT